MVVHPAAKRADPRRTQCTLRARGLAANIQPGLDGHHQYFCMYGRHGRVQASYVAHETLRCDSPPAMELMDNGPRTITVSVTTNDQDYHPAAEFQYYEEPIIFEHPTKHGPNLLAASASMFSVRRPLRLMRERRTLQSMSASSTS